MVYLSCQVAQVLKPGSLGRTGPTGHEICGAEIFRSRRGPRREDLPTQGYIPWQIHGRNGIFTDPWMVDVYGKFVGKSTNPPWFLWVKLQRNRVAPIFWEAHGVGICHIWSLKTGDGQPMIAVGSLKVPRWWTFNHTRGVPLWWWEPLTMRKG